jgi:hypothetical protein
MEDEIIPGDKRQRRLTLVTALLSLLLGLLALTILCRYLGEIRSLAQDDLQAAEEKVLRLAAIVLGLGGLCLVGMGVWFWWLGRRVNLANRFPPPGMKVIKDTRVRTGAKARAVANLAQVVALLCVIAGTVGMWYVYRAAAALLRP